MTASPVVQAVLAYVRHLNPDEMEALCGNPLRQASDAALWAYLCTLPADRLGTLLAEGVTDAGRHRITLPLTSDVLEAWRAWDEWVATVADVPESVRQLGTAAAAGAWGTREEREKGDA